MFFNKFGSRKESNWPAEVAQSIEKLIDSTKEKAVVPITTLAKAFVYGTLAVIISIPVIVVALIGLIRGLHILLNLLPVPQNIWFTYFVIGTIFFVSGLSLWSQRHPKISE